MYLIVCFYFTCMFIQKVGGYQLCIFFYVYLIKLNNCYNINKNNPIRNKVKLMLFFSTFKTHTIFDLSRKVLSLLKVFK